MSVAGGLRSVDAATSDSALKSPHLLGARGESLHGLIPSPPERARLRGITALTATAVNSRRAVNPSVISPRPDR